MRRTPVPRRTLNPTALVGDDNPRWLAALATAFPVALAAVFVMACSRPDTGRLPPAVPLSASAPDAPTPPAEPDPDTTDARTP